MGKKKVVIKVKKQYGFMRLLLDLFLTMITGGLWLIWLLIKFLRNGGL